MSTTVELYGFIYDADVNKEVNKTLKSKVNKKCLHYMYTLVSHLDQIYLTFALTEYQSQFVSF